MRGSDWKDTGTLVTHGAYNQNPHLAKEFRLLIERHPAVPVAS